MTRRELLQGAMTLAVATAGSANAAPGPDEYLDATDYLDITHPQIQTTVRATTAGLSQPRDRARALFGFVRDEIPFGFASGFWNQRASEVLEAGRGYCNTKSTLFTALLRAAGIPARQVFVEIDTAVLSGLIDPGTPMLDHSYTEVFLNGAWQATDAYIVDRPLFGPAQRRVLAEGREMGFGVHRSGTDSWDGTGPRFAQYNLNDPAFAGGRVWGVHDDVGDFYARADAPRNRLNALLRAAFGTLAADANRRADELRRAG